MHNVATNRFILFAGRAFEKRSFGLKIQFLTRIKKPSFGPEVRFLIPIQFLDGLNARRLAAARKFLCGFFGADAPKNPQNCSRSAEGAEGNIGHPFTQLVLVSLGNQLHHPKTSDERTDNCGEQRRKLIAHSC